MTNAADLDKKIAQEKAEIENAPKVKTTSGTIGRCSWCGQPARELQLVEVTHGIPRYKGECCR